MKAVFFHAMIEPNPASMISPVEAILCMAHAHLSTNQAVALYENSQWFRVVEAEVLKNQPMLDKLAVVGIHVHYRYVTLDDKGVE